MSSKTITYGLKILHMEKNINTDTMFECFEGMEKAQPSPFLFTRIHGRIEDMRKDSVKGWSIKFASIGLGALLLINVFIWTLDFSPENSGIIASNNSGMEIFTVNYYLY